MSPFSTAVDTRLDNKRLYGELDAARRETERLSASAAELETELARAKAGAERVAEELRKVQGHLTALLSGRLLRYTRPLRRLWHRLRSMWRT